MIPGHVKQVLAPGSPEAIAELAAICGLEWRGQYWTLHASDGVRKFFDYPDNWNPYERAVHTEMLMTEMAKKGKMLTLMVTSETYSRARYDDDRHTGTGKDWKTAVCEAARGTIKR